MIFNQFFLSLAPLFGWCAECLSQLFKHRNFLLSSLVEQVVSALKVSRGRTYKPFVFFTQHILILPICRLKRAACYTLALCHKALSLLFVNRLYCVVAL